MIRRLGDGFRIIHWRRQQDVTGAHHRTVKKLLMRVEKSLELVLLGQVGAKLIPAQVGGDLVAQLPLGELHFLEHFGEFFMLLLQFAANLFFLRVDFLGGDGVLRELKDVLIDEQVFDEVIEDLFAGLLALSGAMRSRARSTADSGMGCPLTRAATPEEAGGWAEADRYNKTKTGIVHQKRWILRIINLPVPSNGPKANGLHGRDDCN